MEKIEMEMEEIPEVSSDENLEVPEADFDAQFAKKHASEVYEKKFTFTDCIPEELKFETPLFVAPGWAETFETLREPIKVFFDGGRRVLSVDHARFTPRISDENDEAYMEPLSEEEKKILAEYDLEDQGGLPFPELIKARAILSVIESQDVDVTDVVAHSEGAINTMIAAALKPEKFRNIILVGAAGIANKGEDNAAKRVVGGVRTLGQDIHKSITHPKLREAIIRGNNESFKYIGSNPATALEEVGAIAGFNIEKMIEKLAEKGLKISIVHGTDDLMFPLDEMQKMIDNESVYEFFELKGNYHHSLYFKDEAVFIEGVLDSMDKKSE
jgi:pimeloyl-ACP methyl ester carboxylesterase